MNDTLTEATEVAAAAALSPSERATYSRAIAKVAKVNDPTTKPLTEKEHEVYDRIHGAGASNVIPTRARADLGDGMTDVERAAIAAEATREIGAEDVALFRRDGQRSGSAGMSVPEDRYDHDESGNVAESVAASRRAQHSDDRIVTTTDRLAERGVWTNPPPHEGQRPRAPLPGDADAPVGRVVEGDLRTSARPSVDSMELAQEYDELDHLMGDGHRRSQVSFDFLRDSRTEHRHVFSRHYYNVGVLVDRYASTSARVEAEVADKSAKIAAYNATVERQEQLGYLSYVAGVDLSYEDVRPALERKIETKIVAPSAKGNGEPLDPNVVHNLSSLQTRPAHGFARIGERPLPLHDSRTPLAIYYHDAMKGIYEVHVDGAIGRGKSREAAEIEARRVVELATA